MMRACRCGSGHEFEVGTGYGAHRLRWHPECTTPAAVKALAHREYMQAYMKIRRYNAELKAARKLARETKCQTQNK